MTGAAGSGTSSRLIATKGKSSVKLLALITMFCTRSNQRKVLGAEVGLIDFYKQCRKVSQSIFFLYLQTYAVREKKTKYNNIDNSQMVINKEGLGT
jgi:hypothetical protein